MLAWAITAGRARLGGLGLRADRRGDLVVVPLQHTISRRAMHILETHTGFALADHTVVRCKSNYVY